MLAWADGSTSVTSSSGLVLDMPSPELATSDSARIGFVKKSPAHAEALERVRTWTRAHFGLADEVTILVSEIACTLPGCPPLETVVAFWTEADKRHHFKIFKPVAEVVRDDLPPAWLKDALAIPDG